MNEAGQKESDRKSAKDRETNLHEALGGLDRGLDRGLERGLSGGLVMAHLHEGAFLGVGLKSRLPLGHFLR